MNGNVITALNPKRLASVRDNQIEGAVGLRIYGAEGFGSLGRIRMILGLQYQLTPGSLSILRAKRASPVKYGNSDTIIVDPLP